MKICTFYMLLIIILVGCNAEPSLHEFPIIETLTPTIVDSTGATFHGRLIKQGTDLISSYGFVWGIADVHQSIADSNLRHHSKSPNHSKY